MLHVWAVTHLWGQTMAPEDVLDGIKDDEVKAWLNKATKRFNGGIDRITVTKRKGRVKSTGHRLIWILCSRISTLTISI
ncbi:hypothetical protein GGI43DRAFT_221959 [Trichoderma evansii]